MDSKANDKISVQGIMSHLRNRDGVAEVKVFDSLGSTNDTARDMVKKGLAHTAVVIAESQTAGRGRYGRTFFSPPGGIYMSLIMPSQLLRQSGFGEPSIVTAFAAASVCEAIGKLTDKVTTIKGINDVLAGGKKICGILAETARGEAGRGEAGRDCIIIGIGINFSTPEPAFPTELREIAGSLFPDGNAGITKNRLIAEIIDICYEKCHALREN